MQLFLCFTAIQKKVFVFFAEPENLNPVFVTIYLSLFQQNLPAGCDAFETRQFEQQNFDCFLQVL